MTFSFNLVSHAMNSLTTGGHFAEPVGFSAESRYLLFRSSSSTIAPADPNGGITDFFLYDTFDGSIRLVTHTADSETTTANGELSHPSGNTATFDPLFVGERYLLFRHSAPDMAGTDTNGISDVFIYDMQDGSLDLVSHTAASNTTAANGGVGLGGGRFASEDGRHILLRSGAPNMTTTDVNGTGTDLYVYNTEDQSLDLVSHAPGSLTTTTNEIIDLGTISADGKHVLYSSFLQGTAQTLAVQSAMIYNVETQALTRLGAANSTPVTFSPDGRYALYRSTEFTAGNPDPNGPDLRIRDTVNGDDRLVNHAFNDLTTASNQLVPDPGLVGFANLGFSPDSRYIVFQTGATNMAGVDNNNTEDLFVYDVTDQSVDLVSHAFTDNDTTSNAGPFGGGTGAQGAFFSPNSRYFVFSSNSNNIAQVDTNASPDYFVYDTQDGGVVPLALAFNTVATAATGTGGGSSSITTQSNWWSPDGRYLFFTSEGTNLVAPGNDTNNNRDAFVFDAQDGSVDLVSHFVGSGTQALGSMTVTGSSGVTPFSPDSRYLLLESQLPSFANDANNQNDIFLYDTVDGSLDLVSHTMGSLTTTGDFGSISASFSPDSRFVLFASSATNLVPGNTNDLASDVFLYEIATGAVSLVSQTGSGITANRGGLLPRFSPDGKFIIINSESTDLNGVTATDSQFPSPDLFITWLDPPPSNTPPSAISDTNPATDSVPENAADGTAVGIIALATDEESGVTYSLTNNAGGRFAINAASGLVTVANGALLDFEAATSHGIVVRATDAGGLFTEQAFTITLTDVNESGGGGNTPPSPISDANGTIDGVAENAGNGTAVGITALATDAESGVTYSLSSDAGGRFAMDPASGVVTVANGALLDFEAATSHGIVVRATDAGGLFSEQGFTIALTDLPGLILTGTNGKDNLTGSIEPDRLDGGKNKDTLFGGGGADAFIFSASLKEKPDTVMDFTAADDTLVLLHKKFKKLDLGALSEAAFHDIGEAAGKDDRIIYKASGKLLYDKDGKGGADAVVFTKLDGAPDISAADFFVV